VDIGLTDRVVVVTGGSSGIGAATAECFGAEGASVAVTYRDGKDAANAVVERIRGTGGTAMAVPLDLGDPDSAGAAVDAVLAAWGRIDVLVACAVRWGAGGPGPATRFEDVPLGEWSAMLDSNIVGTVAALRAVLPGMRQRRFGRIVLLSSGVAEEGIPGPGPYGTAKSGLHGLTRALAWDCGPDGVLVNAVAPGLTRTARHDGAPPGLLERMAAATPSRRLSGPQDVARLVAFLGSAANGNITGELIRDGSATARAPYLGP
jgi:NAD(P)-dependent dehydrogenase (short-subunit alcohol dehydrogenase family)